MCFDFLQVFIAFSMFAFQALCVKTEEIFNRLEFFSNSLF